MKRALGGRCVSAAAPQAISKPRMSRVGEQCRGVADQAEDDFDNNKKRIERDADCKRASKVTRRVLVSAVIVRMGMHGAVPCADWSGESRCERVSRRVEK